MLPALISLERRGNGQLWKACVGIGWLLTWLSTLGCTRGLIQSAPPRLLPLR